MSTTQQSFSHNGFTLTATGLPASKGKPMTRLVLSDAQGEIDNAAFYTDDVFAPGLGDFERTKGMMLKPDFNPRDPAYDGQFFG